MNKFDEMINCAFIMLDFELDYVKCLTNMKKHSSLNKIVKKNFSC